MAAVVEAQREDRVAGLEHRHVDRHVRLRARVRLDVRVLGAEELLRAVDRELLDLVDDLAAAVVALARVALGVLVRRHRADRLEHGRPREVLGRDQLDLAALPLELLAEQRRDVGVDVVEPRAREVLKGFLRDGHGESPLPGCRGSYCAIPDQPFGWRRPAGGRTAAVLRRHTVGAWAAFSLRQPRHGRMRRTGSWPISARGHWRCSTTAGTTSSHASALPNPLLSAAWLQRAGAVANGAPVRGRRARPTGRSRRRRPHSSCGGPADVLVAHRRDLARHRVEQIHLSRHARRRQACLSAAEAVAAAVLDEARPNLSIGGTRRGSRGAVALAAVDTVAAGDDYRASAGNA